MFPEDGSALIFLENNYITYKRSIQIINCYIKTKPLKEFLSI